MVDTVQPTRRSAAARALTLAAVGLGTLVVVQPLLLAVLTVAVLVAGVVFGIGSRSGDDGGASLAVVLIAAVAELIALAGGVVAITGGVLGIRALTRDTKERGRAITAVVLGGLAALAVVAAALVVAVTVLSVASGASPA